MRVIMTAKILQSAGNCGKGRGDFLSRDAKMGSVPGNGSSLDDQRLRRFMSQGEASGNLLRDHAAELDRHQIHVHRRFERDQLLDFFKSHRAAATRDAVFEDQDRMGVRAAYRFIEVGKRLQGPHLLTLSRR